jgi:hypothetical protein
MSSSESPPHYITEPICSITPQKLENGDLRMAIAVAGQHAYSMFGEEATLTEEFLSKDFKTWESGLISINHENNNDLLGGATLYDIEYDSEKKLIVGSFSGLPDTARKLIDSEFYVGLSQECIPIQFKKNTMDVVKGYGTGVTIVTYPYTPAASQEMGVGVRPDLAAILASKYPTQIEDSMTTNGDGKTVVSVEAFESTVSDNVQLKSQIKTLESEKGTLEKELASWKTKYSELESGEANRTKIAIDAALESFKAELKTTGEREAAVTELKNVMSKEAAESYLATNPTVEQIKSIAGILKAGASKGVGSSNGNNNSEPTFEEINSRFNAKLGRA